MPKHGQYPYMIDCKCDKCTNARARQSAKARQKESNDGGSGWRNQSRNSDATVQTSGGYNRSSHENFSPDAQRTDFEIFDKTGPNGVEKTHLSVDTDGNKTVWHGNKDFES